MDVTALLEKVIDGSAPIVVFLCVALWLVVRTIQKALIWARDHAAPEYKKKSAMLEQSLEQRRADGVRVDTLISSVTKLGDGVNTNGVRLDNHEQHLTRISDKLELIPDETAAAALKRLEAG